MGFARITDEGVEILIRVIPRSSKSGIVGEHGGRLKVRLNSAPVAGAANKELINLLSRRVRTAKNSVALISGATSRNKTVLISGDRRREMLARLTENLGGASG